MQRLSLTTPINEPNEYFRENDASWKRFSDAATALPRGLEIPMIIGGEKIFSDTKGKSLNPSTKELVCTFQEGTAAHGERAVQAALAAKPAWAALTPAARIQKFRDLEAVLARWKYETCATAAVECGYVGTETAVSWAEMMDFVRFNSHFYADLLTEQMGDGPQETNQLALRPLKGFTCAVTPFNFPIAIGFNLPLVMALTGNTVVWKPSSDAVLTSYLLMLALEEAGFPPGVVNFLTGEGPQCLPAVIKHPELTCLNFTGSFNTARVFGNMLFNTEFTRANFPRFIAETGGKDFLVVDKDVDIVDTATLTIQGAFGRSGQKCSATSVLLVHADTWPRLRSELVKQTKSLVMGNPLERNCDLGPVINEKAFTRLASALERAGKDPGCEVLVGGRTSAEKGFFVEPTIIEMKVDKHEFLNTELFGPILAVRTYRTLEEAEALIAQHPYRLTGGVVSRDETFLARAVPRLSELAGNLYVNRKTTGAVVNQQPFGGDAASGTNAKAGGKWYLLNFVSQGTITRRHSRTTTPGAFDKLRGK